MTELSPCSHKEADTCLLLHAVQKGHRILSIHTASKYRCCNPGNCYVQSDDELWLAYCISGFIKLSVVFTGFDTVSTFGRRGKKTEYSVWKVFSDVTEVFEDFMFSISDLSLLERFVVLLYDWTSDPLMVNHVRKWLLHRSQSLEVIPPSQAVLEDHIKRASYRVHFWSSNSNGRTSQSSIFGWWQDATGWYPL